MEKEKEKDLTLRLIGEMLEKGLKDADEYKKCFVKLTPELAEHVISMVENTNDDDWEKYEPYLPFEVWDDKECDKWRTHIGEIIQISCFDNSYDTIMEDKSLPDGVKIQFADDMLDLALDCICNNFFDGGTNYPPYWDFIDLDKSITLLKANGLSDKEISKKFHTSRKRAMQGTFPDMT
nr:hypothetical protein [uncultured Prevotella sp.]